MHITLTIYAHAVPKGRHGASDRMAALMNGTSLETLTSLAVASTSNDAPQVIELAGSTGESWNQILETLEEWNSYLEREGVTFEGPSP